MEIGTQSCRCKELCVFVTFELKLNEFRKSVKNERSLDNKQFWVGFLKFIQFWLKISASNL